MGRLLYALVFCVALPAVLWVWTMAMETRINLPRVHWPMAGGLIAASGIGLMLWAMAQLWMEAGGLPMNAYPPARRASGGPFAWINHPIYVGFVLAWAGLMIAVGSTAGLWVTTPLLAAGCAALVWGYEREATEARLGPRPAPPFLRLARASAALPQIAERLSVYVLILLPWLILYMAIGQMHADDFIDTYVGFERQWPVWPETELLYALVYPMVVAAPLVVRRSDVLRRFEIAAIVAMVIGFWCYLALPFVAFPKPFVATNWLGELLELERIDGIDGRAAMPSFHVEWALAAAAAWASLGTAWRAMAWIIGAAIAASCIATGMHSLADVLAGAALFAIAWNSQPIWRWMLRVAERVANGWWEWRLGPMRVLVHSLYAFAAAFLGAAAAGMLAGPNGLAPLLLVAAFGLLGAGAWGQIVTGGKGLARPFGYFGHVMGSGIGLACAAMLWDGVWIVAAAIATAAPIAQGVGRLRCLVQGCCHGKAAIDVAGLCYRDPRSRVMKFSSLGGHPVHATPLYSMISNAMIFGLLLRLWSIGVAAPFICGSYLALSGTARFVEEHHRGEPNTPIYAGLRLYQWLALAATASGMVVAVLGGPAAAFPRDFNAASIPLAVLVGVAYGIAMGVDFPASSRRFARLG